MRWSIWVRTEGLIWLVDVMMKWEAAHAVPPPNATTSATMAIRLERKSFFIDGLSVATVEVS